MGQIDMPFVAVNNKGLEVKNITKSYSKKKILDNVSLNLDRGESVALLGPNGAGKTSLFYIVMGLIKSDSGSIIYLKKSKTNFGQDLEISKIKMSKKLKIKKVKTATRKKKFNEINFLEFLGER